MAVALTRVRSAGDTGLTVPALSSRHSVRWLTTSPSADTLITAKQIYLNMGIGRNVERAIQQLRQPAAINSSVGVCKAIWRASGRTQLGLCTRSNVSNHGFR